MRQSNYDLFPSTKIDGAAITGWDNVTEQIAQLAKIHKIIVVDVYPGVNEDEVLDQLKKIDFGLVYNTRDLFFDEEKIIAMTDRYLTSDVLFGYISPLKIQEYFHPGKLTDAEKNIEEYSGSVLVFGIGAAVVAAAANACIIYLDLSRWEIIQRFRKSQAKSIGMDGSKEPVSIQYKRGYFNDWKVADRHKESLFNKVSFWIDTHRFQDPVMIDQQTFMNGISQTIKRPFRVVPFFDAAPWGGQWMKKKFDLDKKNINYGWCFDCVPEENSLLFDINGTRFELPSINLVFLESTALLGEQVEARFGKEFPIRFDFLDTMQGGNLSLQVHPTVHFIKEHFGLHYTQDESYYIIDAEEDAFVYLGLKVSRELEEQMFDELIDANNGKSIFNADDYVNKIPVRKHDHFLIPAGTIHCSGSNSLVLEVSSTPNLFTFKLWDWEREGLDGKPRPINIERGKEVVNWKFDTVYTHNNLVNQFVRVNAGEGWVEEKTGLHKNEFIETRRFTFTGLTQHHTGNSVNVINLVEGTEVIVESPTHTFEPFVIHYAETFIVPQSLGNYTIRPSGQSNGKPCKILKAYVRI